MKDRGIVFACGRCADEMDLSVRKSFDDRLGGERTVVVANINNDCDRVGSTSEVGDIRLVEIGSDWRQVNELNANVFPIHHARDRLACGEWIRGHFRCRLRELSQQAALAAIWSAEKNDGAGALPGNLVTGRRLLRAGLGRFDLVVDFRDLRLEDDLNFFARLVLGQDHPHLLESGELLFRRAGLFILGLGIVVLGR